MSFAKSKISYFTGVTTHFENSTLIQVQPVSVWSILAALYGL